MKKRFDSFNFQYIKFLPKIDTISILSMRSRAGRVYNARAKVVYLNLKSGKLGLEFFEQKLGFEILAPSSFVTKFGNKTVGSKNFETQFLFKKLKPKFSNYPSSSYPFFLSEI